MRRFTEVIRTIGGLLLLECGMLLIPLTVALCERTPSLWGFLTAAGCTGISGALLVILFRERQSHINRRDAYLLTTIIWVLFSLFGMIPFMMSAPSLPVADAFFEAMSGFTTTGASVIPDVEACDHSILLWRSIMQWVGGLGIVLFILAVLPTLNHRGGMSMFDTEMTGITHDKLHPRIRQTAYSLWKVYVTLTLVLFFLLWIGPMDFFDAVCHSLSTLATGGFSTRNDSIFGFHSTYIASVIAVFMFIAGINFVLLYNFGRGRWKQMWRNDVLRFYFAVVFGLCVLIDISELIRGVEPSVQTMVLNPFFQITSAITTTGFTYLGFSQWGGVGLLVIIFLMFSGACAGSTSGAIKLDRILALRKNCTKEAALTLYPNHIHSFQINGKMVSPAQMERISAFMTYYLLFIGILILLTCASGMSFDNAFFVSASCLGNNGLGYGDTAAGFGCLTPAIKWVMSAAMLVGRLEIFTVVSIFTAAFWRE